MGYGCGLGTCTSCDTENTPINGRGWCVACYHRWYRAGANPDEAPPAHRHGPEYSAALRAEVAWLVQQCGESVEQAATRAGVSVDTAERYLAPPKPAGPPQECAYGGCTAVPTYRRWCDDHKNVRGLYLTLRADGVERHAAARRVGVRWKSTYAWEPGRSGVGRPRKQVAA